jgi:hypothetical protein
MTSVYRLAFGIILPIEFRQMLGNMSQTAVEAQNPPHSTLNQIDHHIYRYELERCLQGIKSGLTSFTDHTVAFGAAVTPMIPGIHSIARMGTIYSAHRTTIPRLSAQ